MEADIKCPIWGTEAKSRWYKGYYVFYDSPRAGGVFGVLAGFEDTLGSLDSKDKANLSTNILVQNLRNILIEIEPNNLQSIIRAGELNPNNRIKLLLKTIANKFPQQFERFSYPKSEFLAAIGSQLSDDDENLLRYYFNHLEHVQLINDLDKFMGGGYCRLSFKAYDLLDQIGFNVTNSEQIFVAMWFGGNMMQVYDLAIAKAIRDAGYEPMLINNKPTNEKIDDEIIAEIRKSKAVIVDLTCGVTFKEANENSAKIGAPRGGVYYEAGFAHGLGLPVIWTIDEAVASIENVVHFDIQQYPQIRWKHEELPQFSNALRHRIEATLGRGSSTSGHS